MNFKRAMIISIGSYILTLGVGIPLMIAAGAQIGPEFVPNRNQMLVSMILALVFTVLGAAVYFKPRQVGASAKLGLWFGIVATLVAMFLDGLLFGLIFVLGGDPLPVLKSAYTHWFFPILIVTGLSGTALAGKLLARGKP